MEALKRGCYAGLVILLAVVFVTGYLGAVLAEKMLAKKLDSVS